MPAVVLVEQASEKEAAVKTRQTHPFDVRTGIDIGQVGTIPDNAHFIFMYRHILLEPKIRW